LATLWRGGFVCLPQQEQGDALPFEFVVPRGPVGGERGESVSGWWWWKQPLLQRGVIEPLR
jgi:hypothetical protein